MHAKTQHARNARLLLGLALLGCSPLEPLPPIQPIADNSQPAATAAAGLPGLSMVDLYGNLEPRGFRIDRQPGHVVCTSAGGELVAIGYGSGSTLESVSATATGPNAADFLALIASLPYTASTPEQSAAWVRDSIAAGRSSDRVAGPVRLALELRESYTLTLAAE